MLDEFYRVAFRKKIYGSIDELQADLDRWVKSYNEERPHQGRWCFGKTPMQTFLDAIAAGEGENDRRLTTIRQQTRPLSRRRLSDQVPATTRDWGKGSADNIRANGRLDPHQQAEDMTAPTTSATRKIALDQRAPSRHDNAHGN